MTVLTLTSARAALRKDVLGRKRRSPRLLAALRAAGTPSRLSLGRAGVGATMLARPAGVPSLLGVDTATSGRMAWAVQMLGAREVALGLGGWAALRGGDARAARLWLGAGLLADSADALVIAYAVGRGRVATAPGAAVVAVAAGAAAVQAGALGTRVGRWRG